MSRELLDLKRDLKALLKRVNAAIGAGGTGDGWEKEGEAADIIKQAVAEEWGIAVEKMLAKGRTAQVALPRQVVMYLCRKMTELTFEQIATATNRGDHGTIIWGVDAISDRVETDAKFKERVDKVRGVVQQRLQQVAGAAAKTS